MSNTTANDESVYLRDLDGTGSMHPCAKGDDGCVEYISVNESAAKDAKLAQQEVVIKAFTAFAECDEAYDSEDNEDWLEIFENHGWDRTQTAAVSFLHSLRNKAFALAKATPVEGRE